jgi:hypothetical protein
MGWLTGVFVTIPVGTGLADEMGRVFVASGRAVWVNTTWVESAARVSAAEV